MEFERLSQKYVASAAHPGDVPSGYEVRRAGRKWSSENEAVEKLLEFVPTGARALDVPVGTGRLIPFFAARDFEMHGLDISEDMLSEAGRRADSIGAKIQLGQGDIRNIPFPDGDFDLVSCLRFFNWIDANGVQTAMTELARVSGDRLLVGVRQYAIFRRVTAIELYRALIRLFGVPRYLAKRWGGLVYHDPAFLHRLFERLGLEVAQSCIVERRWDGTDYVFYLLRKSQAG